MKQLLLFILTLFTFSGALYSKTYSNININKTTEDGMSFKRNHLYFHTPSEPPLNKGSS